MDKVLVKKNINTIITKTFTFYAYLFAEKTKEEAVLPFRQGAVCCKNIIGPQECLHIV